MGSQPRHNIDALLETFAARIVVNHRAHRERGERGEGNGRMGDRRSLL